MERLDVAIIGAGIFGLSAAWALRKRGLRIAVFERSMVGAGASGGLIGALSPHMPEKWNPKKAFQFEALVTSGAFWREIERISGKPTGYNPTGRLMPLWSEKALELAKARAVSAAELWGGHAKWQIVQHPEGCIRTSHGWVHETLSAKLNPRLALTALSEALGLEGVQIHGEKEIAANTSLNAEHVVYAVGSKTADLLPEFPGGFWSAVKGQSALLRARLPDQMPIVFHAGTYVVPHGQDMVAVGSTSETEFSDPASTDIQLDQVIARAQEIVPALAGAGVVERWAGLRPRARLPDPAIGPIPGRPNTWVMSGGFKIGIGLGPLLGEAVAAMICNEDHKLPETFTLHHQLNR